MTQAVFGKRDPEVSIQNVRSGSGPDDSSRSCHGSGASCGRTMPSRRMRRSTRFLPTRRPFCPQLTVNAGTGRRPLGQPFVCGFDLYDQLRDFHCSQSLGTPLPGVVASPARNTEHFGIGSIGHCALLLRRCARTSRVLLAKKDVAFFKISRSISRRFTRLRNSVSSVAFGCRQRIRGPLPASTAARLTHSRSAVSVRSNCFVTPRLSCHPFRAAQTNWRSALNSAPILPRLRFVIAHSSCVTTLRGVSINRGAPERA